MDVAFWLGNAQGAIAKGEAMTGLDDVQKIERDVFVYRAFILQGRGQIVKDEIKEDNDNTALLAVRLLARDALGEDVMDEVKSLLENSVTGSNPTLQLIASQLYEKQRNFDEALRVLHSTRSLEGRAQMALLYLGINRIEQAEKELKAMMQQEDDHVLTSLTAARVLLWQGGAKKGQEALGLLEDLIDKFGATAMLLNSCATAQMLLGRFEEAEQSLRDAQTKDPNNVITMLALSSCYAQQGKVQLAQRATLQAKQFAKHPQVVLFDKAEEEFDLAMK